MRALRTSAFAVCVAVAFTVPAIHGQAGQEADRKVAGGGIKVPGWMGAIDSQAAGQGKTINDSKFEKQGDVLHLTIGPAAVYWNAANTASGDYTVKATFNEPKMAPSDHPHPMGVFIGGSKLGTPEQSLMYCTAYRDGSFLVRQFAGGKVNTVMRKTPNAAVQKGGAMDPVTQEVAWVVKGGRAECQINGMTVAGFDKADVVGPGKLDSTDGIYGIRVSHNMDLTVKDLKVTKP